MNYKQKEQNKKRLTSAQIDGAEDMAMADPPQRHPPARTESHRCTPLRDRRQWRATAQRRSSRHSNRSGATPFSLIRRSGNSGRRPHEQWRCNSSAFCLAAVAAATHSRRGKPVLRRSDSHSRAHAGPRPLHPRGKIDDAAAQPQAVACGQRLTVSLQV